MWKMTRRRPRPEPRRSWDKPLVASHNLIVIPKSMNRQLIEENARVFHFNLSVGEMAELDPLDETGGTDRALEERWW